MGVNAPPCAACVNIDVNSGIAKRTPQWNAAKVNGKLIVSGAYLNRLVAKPLP